MGGGGGGGGDIRANSSVRESRAQVLRSTRLALDEMPGVASPLPDEQASANNQNRGSGLVHNLENHRSEQQ